MGAALRAVACSIYGALLGEARSSFWRAWWLSTAVLCAQAPILLAITDMALQLGLFYKFTARGSIKISRYQVGVHTMRRVGRLCFGSDEP